MLNETLAFTKCILDFTLLLWFSMQFFPFRWEKHCLITGCFLTGLSVVLFFVNSLHIPYINTLTVFLCILSVNLFLFKSGVSARILCSAFEVLLIIICEFIPILVYASMIRLNMASAVNETIKNACFSLTSTGLLCVILITARFFLRLKQGKDDGDITISENLAIVTVPLVSILTIYHIFYISAANTEADNVRESLSLFLLLGIMFMNLAVILGDNHRKKRYQLQRELDRLSRLEHLDQVVIGQQDAFIEELKGFAHDYTKQIDGIKHLILAGESSQTSQSVEQNLRTYTDEMLRHIDDSYRFAFIPSPALRSILCQTQLRCHSAGIKFDTHILYADFSFMAFPDIYTIFENPLENAVRACMEIKDSSLPRQIRLSITRNKNLVWVEIKNAKENPVLVKKGRIQTTKPDAPKHGLGLKNMERTVKRYGGYLHVEYTSDEFTVTMALPVPNTGNLEVKEGRFK